jgi:hypothetical protein
VAVASAWRTLPCSSEKSVGGRRRFVTVVDMVFVIMRVAWWVKKLKMRGLRYDTVCRGINLCQNYSSDGMSVLNL